jgi:cyclohexa-1,5-dienecarbonyl-CoA hydratase
MIRSELRRDGGHLGLVLDAPKGNILTLAEIGDLRRALAAASASSQTKLITIEGAGDHFSFGASVDEHRPGIINAVLRELDGLIRDLIAAPAPTGAIVRGRCLGGGFEIALACDFIFAATDAVLGVPEITLGVFPPAAAALLPIRIGTSRATHAIVTGRTATTGEWSEAGLIELSAAAPELEAAVDRWFDTNLAGRSAAALRCAVWASRSLTRRHLDGVLPELEHLYLDTLMRTHDASEGISAFLEKRAPVWSHS